MPIKLKCKCGKMLKTGDDGAGKRVKCPACATVLLVPGGAPKVASQPAKPPAPPARAARPARPAAPPPLPTPVQEPAKFHTLDSDDHGNFALEDDGDGYGFADRDDPAGESEAPPLPPIERAVPRTPGPRQPARKKSSGPSILSQIGTFLVAALGQVVFRMLIRLGIAVVVIVGLLIYLAVRGPAIGVGDWTDAIETSPHTVTLNVNGKDIQIANARMDFGPFMGGLYSVEIVGQQADGTYLSLFFPTQKTAPSQLAGETLVTDHAKSNPTRLMNDDFENRIHFGTRFYQGHMVRATVTAASDSEITLSLDATFLEFQNEDDEGAGSEIPVKGTITLPVRSRS